MLHVKGFPNNTSVKFIDVLLRVGCQNLKHVLGIPKHLISFPNMFYGDYTVQLAINLLIILYVCLVF